MLVKGPPKIIWMTFQWINQLVCWHPDWWSPHPRSQGLIGHDTDLVFSEVTYVYTNKVEGFVKFRLGGLWGLFQDRSYIETCFELTSHKISFIHKLSPTVRYLLTHWSLEDMAVIPKCNFQTHLTDWYHDYLKANSSHVNAKELNGDKSAFAQTMA